MSMYSQSSTAIDAWGGKHNDLENKHFLAGHDMAPGPCYVFFDLRVTIQDHLIMQITTARDACEQALACWQLNTMTPACVAVLTGNIGTALDKTRGSSEGGCSCNDTPLLECRAGIARTHVTIRTAPGAQTRRKARSTPVTTIGRCGVVVQHT